MRASSSAVNPTLVVLVRPALHSIQRSLVAGFILARAIKRDAFLGVVSTVSPKMSGRA
jgi:hypothetical protein